MATGPARSGPSKSEDARLVAGLAKRDESALRTLIAVHAPSVYGRTLQILQRPDLAEQAAQDTLLVPWWDPSRFDIRKGSLRSFLVGIARHKALDLVRLDTSAPSPDSLAAAAVTKEMATTTGERIGTESTVAVQEALSRLPEPKREVILLAYFGGLTYREVSNRLRIPVETAKARIRSALIDLRAILALEDPHELRNLKRNR